MRLPRRLAAPVAALALGACVHGLSPALPPSAPQDARERRRAEVGACANGTLPTWIDDEALSAAMSTDQREASASRANESFHGATFSPQPPVTAQTGPRTRAVLSERQAFQEWCATVRGGKRPTP